MTFQNWADLLNVASDAAEPTYPASLVLTGATLLDKALQERIKVEGWSVPIPPGRRRNEPTLDDRIAFCHARGLVQRAELDGAKGLRNEIAHHAWIPEPSAAMRAAERLGRAALSVSGELTPARERTLADWCANELRRLPKKGRVIEFEHLDLICLTLAVKNEDDSRGMALLFAHSYFDFALRSFAIHARRRAQLTDDEVTQYKDAHWTSKLKQALGLAQVTAPYALSSLTDRIVIVVRARNAYAHESKAPSKDETRSHVQDLIAFVTPLRAIALDFGVPPHLLESPKLSREVSRVGYGEVILDILFA